MTTQDLSADSMTTLKAELDSAVETINTLCSRVKSLEAEVALLKKRSDVEIPSDVLIAISAAVSAFLGNKGRVKAVHFDRHRTWAMQGRQNVQTRRL